MAAESLSPYGGALDPDAIARTRAADLSRSIALREDFDRLREAERKILRAQEARKITPMAFMTGSLPSNAVEPTITQDLLHQAINRYRPGVDSQGNPISVLDEGAPERVAAHLEGVFGKLEDRPSWANENEYAEAGRKFAEENAQRYGSKSSAYHASKNLLAPERYKYMQEVGRTVDLLRSLSKGTPITSWQYYSQSKDRPLARLDAFSNERELAGLNEAGYERFAGQWPEFFADPVSPLAWYLRTGQTAPNAIKYSSRPGAGGDKRSGGPVYPAMAFPSASMASPLAGLGAASLLPTGEALSNAADYNDFQQRFRLGATEVMDIPSLPDNATPEQVAAHEDAYRKRRKEVYEMEAMMRPPSWHETLNSVPVLPNVSAGVADTVGALGDALDPTLGASVLAGVPARVAASSPARITAGLAARHGRGYAASLIAKHMAGGLQSLSPAERAVFRSLQKQLPGRIASAVGGQAVSEMVGEAPMSGLAAGAMAASGRDRTYADYWTESAEAGLDPDVLLHGMGNDAFGNLAADVVGKAMSEGVGALDPYEAAVLQGLQASAAEARKRAHAQFQALQNTAPQDIWRARTQREPSSGQAMPHQDLYDMPLQ